MKIICAGLGKTGTVSLAEALKTLGHNAFHFMDHMSYHGKEWRDLYHDGIVPNFATMYKDVDAVTDLPAAFWFQEILEVFPDAKVILTVRDSEEQWVQSLLKHFKLVDEIFPLYYQILPRPRQMRSFITKLHHATWGSENLNSSFLYKKKYREHNQRVQAIVPANNLLVFNVKEGWQPLCKFLDCAVPSQDFPRKNVAGSDILNSPQIRRWKMETLALFAALGVFVALIVSVVARSV